MGYPSQGGLATLLCKLVEFNTFGIRIEEIKVPLSEKAKEFCQLWGLDPLYLANQGRVVLVSRAEDAELIVQIMKKQASGEKAAIIGSVNEDIPGRVILQTEGGVEKILEMREGEWSVRVT
jgi:hydrogenase expression/formation protein HypE